jgi:hypothetical protein
MLNQADCQHLRLQPEISAITTVIAIQVTMWGAVCEDCGRKWDVGQVLQAVTDAAGLRNQVEVLMGALADIAFSGDMTLEVARAKARRIRGQCAESEAAAPPEART